MSSYGYEFIRLNWIIYLKKWKMSCTLDGKIRIHARLSNTSYMRVYYWTNVSQEGCTSANFPHYILSRDRDEGFVSNRSKDVSHDNKIHLCTTELPNESASFVVIFVLFFFHLGRLSDLCFKQKCWKSFYSLDKNILFSYEIIRGIQQATSISFFPSVGNQSGNKRKHILHSWVADQSTASLLARGSHLNV